jgi:2,5-furandicarboxylate decarboxylase 1
LAVSLRSWLAEAPEVGLRRVDRLVHPMEYEATALAVQLPEASPVLFTRAADLDGHDSGYGLLFNAYATRESLGLVLSIKAAAWVDLLEQYGPREKQTRPPAPVTDVPAQQHRLTGTEVDLRALPWIRHVEGDGGPYFTPVTVSRKPGDDGHNLSWNRAMYLDRNHIGVHISPRQLWGLHRTAEEAGRDLPVTLVLGHHPAFNLASAARTPLHVDEYAIAGALLGEPLAVAPSLSYGDELMIPAEAEALIEGRLLAGRRAVEGPFGEFMTYLGPQKLSHVLEVDAITWRDDPVVLGVLAGYADHLNAHVSIHAGHLLAARTAVPQVRQVAWFRGGGPTTLVISMRKTADGQPMRAAMAVMAPANTVKQVIVVDDDIDVFDAQQVMWALSTRVRADRDIAILPNLQGHLLDPSQEGYASTSGLVIDATWPQGSQPPPVARVPADALSRFRLSDYGLEGL